MEESLKKLFISFLLKLTLVTIPILAGYVALPYVFSNIQMPAYPILIFAFLFLFTAMAYWVMIYAIKNNPGFFMQLTLASMVFKLLIYCVFILVVIYANKSAAVPNVILFLGVYFVYTVLEMSMLYRKLGLK